MNPKFAINVERNLLTQLFYRILLEHFSTTEIMLIGTKQQLSKGNIFAVRGDIQDGRILEAGYGVQCTLEIHIN